MSTTWFANLMFNFFGPMFLDTEFLGPKICFGPLFFNMNVFWTQNFLDLILFGPKSLKSDLHSPLLEILFAVMT